MSWQITGSVGSWEKGARNAETDVQVVQKLLAAAAHKLGDPALDPKGIDGDIARPSSKSSTVKAIVRFQKRILPKADGLIEAGGQTWQALVRVVETTTTPAPAVAEFYFPFPSVPTASWTTGPRKFGANRSGGKRAHAGCDLYFPKGSWIHAVADGTVVRGPYAFYAATFALEIDHGGFLARYGEVQANTLVNEGDTVKAGQKIAKVGHLVGIVVPSDMLHLELYDKTATGPLTVDAAHSKKRADGVPFLRRKDLMDPTPRLNEWKSHLPKP
jgi:murein DD-endopeptidase MepM/ murein hydrolase activator NlpD